MKIQKVISVSTTVVVASALAMTTIAPATAAPRAAEPIAETVVSVTGSSVGDAQQIEELLRAIDQIPESVLLKGDAATRLWVAQNLQEKPLTIEGMVVTEPTGFLECSGAILLAIGTTAIPIAKIIKIKKLMDSLGGVTKAIKLMWGASFSHEKLKALGGAAAALGAELLGIAAVKKACPWKW
ncbi:hypothetical protein [Devriesea agamarum]|uniref:hypothetical protein n=1 Tax=Devriesea agamarum TaxID=472569 RepID=UPI0012EE80DC|nr:hypothetical protein [Devriesea agamarum]